MDFKESIAEFIEKRAGIYIENELRNQIETHFFNEVMPKLIEEVKQKIHLRLIENKDKLRIDLWFGEIKE